MEFFTFFRRKVLRPAWEFSTQGVLWRLHPAPESTFVGEERDPVSRAAALFCLDGKTGKLLWRGEEQSGGWWTGVSGIFRGVLLLHGFATPELPEEKRIIALDMRTGKVLWRNEDVTFLGVKEGEVVASRRIPGGTEITRLSLRGGVVEGRVSAEEERGLLQRADVDERGDGDARYPVMIGEEEARALPGLARFIPRGAGPMEFLELESAFVLGQAVADAAATPAKPSFTRCVTVIEKGTGRLLYRVTVDRSLPFVPRGSFMARERVLYCIREKKTITAVAMRAPRQLSSPTSSEIR